MIRRPPRSTLFPYHDALPICAGNHAVYGIAAALERHPHHVGAGLAFEILDEQYVRQGRRGIAQRGDRKSTRLNSSHANISYAVFCLKKKNLKTNSTSSGSLPL